MNKVILQGNLGVDPELRYTRSEKPVCNFTLATNDRFSDKPEWHRIVVWGKTAEACAKHLAKGRTVTIEGTIRYRKWEDRQGQTRYTTEIHTQQVVFGPSRGSAGVESQQEVPEASLEDLDGDETLKLNSEAPF